MVESGWCRVIGDRCAVIGGRLLGESVGWVWWVSGKEKRTSPPKGSAPLFQRLDELEHLLGFLAVFVGLFEFGDGGC